MKRPARRPARKSGAMPMHGALAGTATGGAAVMPAATGDAAAAVARAARTPATEVRAGARARVATGAAGARKRPPGPSIPRSPTRSREPGRNELAGEPAQPAGSPNGSVLERHERHRVVVVHRDHE